MRNPLTKRIPRELKRDMGKYIALFLFLTFCIAFISGFLVAGDSMRIAYDNSFEKYKIESGHFTLSSELDSTTKENVEDLGVEVYESFYKDFDIGDGHTFRIYKNRDEINKLDIFEGTLPEKSGDITVDRLYAENNGIKVGDTVKVGGKTMTVCGTVSFSDYSALFQNNTDTMFNAGKFNVSAVTEEDFDELTGGSYTYCYSWLNNDTGLTDKEAEDLSDDITEELYKTGTLSDIVKRADNQAIMFTGDDISSDRLMMIVLLYILIVVLGFIFAVTSRDTIEQEAGTIGTLRASGYTRGELTRHYLVLPTLVTFIAAIVGNVLGYTVMKDCVAGMYYHSYSLPPYETLWNADAFLLTTVVPCILICVINLLVISKSMRLPPLQFLRRDLHKKKKKRVVKLPNFRFLTRFRLRIIFQNIPSYIILVLGINFAGLLLFFGLVMNPVLDNYKTEVINNMAADYQYVLKTTAETETDGAEKYCLTGLYEFNDEEISVYGITENSKYFSKLSLPNGKDEAVASESYLDKFGYSVGDKVTLKDKYGDNEYTFTITGSCYYPSAMGVFMSSDSFNEVFDMDDGYFTGYFSNSEITDIDDKLIATTITQDDLTVVTDQLENSMGSMFTLLVGFSAVVYIILMYLLAKLIIEKNEQNISMLKILGYSNREASKLYNRSTTIVVIVSLVLSAPVISWLFEAIYRYFMFEMNGWLPYDIPWYVFAEMIVIGIACYAFIYLILQRKVNKIPLATALKSDE